MKFFGLFGGKPKVQKESPFDVIAGLRPIAVYAIIAVVLAIIAFVYYIKVKYSLAGINSMPMGEMEKETRIISVGVILAGSTICFILAALTRGTAGHIRWSMYLMGLMGWALEGAAVYQGRFGAMTHSVAVISTAKIESSELEGQIKKQEALVESFSELSRAAQYQSEKLANDASSARYQSVKLANAAIAAKNKKASNKITEGERRALNNAPALIKSAETSSKNAVSLSDNAAIASAELEKMRSKLTLARANANAQSEAKTFGEYAWVKPLVETAFISLFEILLISFLGGLIRPLSNKSKEKKNKREVEQQCEPEVEMRRGDYERPETRDDGAGRRAAAAAAVAGAGVLGGGGAVYAAQTHVPEVSMPSYHTPVGAGWGATSAPRVQMLDSLTPVATVATGVVAPPEHTHTEPIAEPAPIAPVADDGGWEGGLLAGIRDFEGAGDGVGVVALADPHSDPTGVSVDDADIDPAAFSVVPTAPSGEGDEEKYQRLVSGLRSGDYSGAGNKAIQRHVGVGKDKAASFLFRMKMEGVVSPPKREGGAYIVNK